MTTGNLVADRRETHVLDAAAAERFYVLARCDSEQGFSPVQGFSLSNRPRPVFCTALTTVDQTRKQAGDVPAPLATRRRCRSRYDGPDAALTASAALIAEQAGGSMRTMQMAADYARTRFQFARAIGSFQAVKHMCVDMLLEAQSAVSAPGTSPRRSTPGNLTASRSRLAQAYCATPRDNRRGDHPGTRRHRIHLGASGSSLSAQAGPMRRSSATRHGTGERYLRLRGDLMTDDRIRAEVRAG